jgi:YVTN family beta-propeller protein
MIDARADKVVATIPVGVGPFDVAADRAHVYVADLGPATVSVIDARTRKVVRTIPDGVAGTTDPFDVTVSQGVAYVVNQGDGDVSMIDTRTGKLTATVPVGSTPYGVAVASRRQ